MPCYRLSSLLSLCILVAAAPSRSASLHAVHWNKYATAHFDIVFHDAVRPQADIARQFLEPAYDKITKDLGMRERGVRISVVLTGQPDESNGSATPLGHNILIYTRPAQVMAAGDIAWLKRVMAHELTHQITFLALRKGFWGIWSELYKTSHMPAWFMEGLAQYEAESWDAKRNTFFAHALYNSALEPYPDLAVYTKFSPVSGRLVYEQGHAFVRYLAETEGPDFWARVLKRVRVIPLWSEIKALLSPLTAGILPLEGAIRAESSKWTGRHYRDFTDSLRAALPPGAAPAAAWNGGIQGFAIVWQMKRSPDGTLWFTGQRDWETPVTDLYSLRGKAGAVKVRSWVDPVFDLSADGKRVLCVRSYQNPDRDAVEKLFLIDAAGDGERFISDGASHPLFWGPDSLVFSHYRAGRQALAFCALSGACREAAPDTLDGFYALSPSRNGLLLNANDAAGRQGIYEYSRAGSFALLFRDTVTAEFPMEGPDGGVWMLHDRGGLLQVDGFDRESGAVYPVATYPLGTFFPQQVAPGVFASVAQTGARKSWAMQPVELRMPAMSGPDTIAAPAADTAGDSWALPDSARQRASAAQDTIDTFDAPLFLTEPAYPFPLDSAIGFDSGEYNGFANIQPLIAGPASFAKFTGGALGAFIALADPLGVHSISFAGSPNDFDNPYYEAEYVNNASAIQVTLAGSNTDYRLSEFAPRSLWRRMALERRTSDYSARFDLPMPAPVPLGHHFWIGFQAKVAITDWRLAGTEDEAAMKILKMDEWQDTKVIAQLHFAYLYSRPNAYAMVHPLLKTDLEASPGIGISEPGPEPRLFLYARQTFPLWDELTFTARYQLDMFNEQRIPHYGRLPDGSDVGFYSGVDGEIHDAYAGMDFPIHKGYLGEWPLLGLWNYLGGGVFLGYQFETYKDFPGKPGSGYSGETGAAGAKVDLLFHVMRRLPIVLSYAAQYDYLREAMEFRIGFEAEGIPRSLSLAGVRRDRHRLPVRSR